MYVNNKMRSNLSFDTEEIKFSIFGRMKYKIDKKN